MNQVDDNKVYLNRQISTIKPCARQIKALAAYQLENLAKPYLRSAGFNQTAGYGKALSSNSLEKRDLRQLSRSV